MKRKLGKSQKEVLIAYFKAVEEVRKTTHNLSQHLVSRLRIKPTLQLALRIDSNLGPNNYEAAVPTINCNNQCKSKDNEKKNKLFKPCKWYKNYSCHVFQK
jgi:hypothetical protein